MKPVLEVARLSFGFDPRAPVLREISFTVFEGERVGVVGANGAGKSTLLWSLLGLLRARGTVRLFGGQVTQTALERVGVVFQNPEDQLFMPSLLEDAALPLVNRGLPLAEAQGRAMRALASMGMDGRAARPASQLSLGERKRASIAAALAASPDLLLLDEPTAELDGRSVRRLADTLASLPVTWLLTSHHLEFLRRVASRAIVLSEGAILADGTAAEVLADTDLLERAGLV